MKGAARTIQLTEAGYRLTDLMRAGVEPMTGREANNGRQPTTPRCPVCKSFAKVTPRGHVRAHAYRGNECAGAGELSVTR